VDPNTALFLLGANWAAVDIFRSIHALLRLQSNQPEYELSFTKCMGNYGAAFTVVICGTLHALLQIPFTIDLFVGMKCMSRRLRILVVGLVLPLIALTATAFGPVLTGLGGTAIDFFPALYWKGTDNVLHAMLIVYSAGTSILLVAPSFWLVYALQQAVLPAGLVTMIKKVMSSPFNSPVIAKDLFIMLPPIFRRVEYCRSDKFQRRLVLGSGASPATNGCIRVDNCRSCDVDDVRSR
jgi:hypothetical protein